MTTRRVFFKGASALAAAAIFPLTACTVTKDANGKTYSLDVSKLDALLQSMDDGATTFINAVGNVGILSTAQVTKFNGYVTNLSRLEKTISGYIGKDVSLTVASSWLVTAENAVNGIADIVEDVQPLLPTKAVTIINSVVSLLPIVESIINVAVASKMSIDYNNVADTSKRTHLKGYRRYTEQEAVAIINSSKN